MGFDTSTPPTFTNSRALPKESKPFWYSRTASSGRTRESLSSGGIRNASVSGSEIFKVSFLIVFLGLRNNVIIALTTD